MKQETPHLPLHGVHVVVSQNTLHVRLGLFALDDISFNTGECAVVTCRHENNFGVCTFGHRLESVQVANLHGALSGKNVRRFSHELGCHNLALGRNDLGLGKTLLLCSGRERFLQFSTELKVLNQN